MKLAVYETLSNIRSAGDKKYEISAEPSLTVGEFKKLVEQEANIPHNEQRLIYSGRVLKDTETLASYKVQDGHSIHLVKSVKKASTSSATGTSSSSSTTGNADAIPNNIAAGINANDPLAGLTGARYAGYGLNLPSADMFGPDGGLGGMPNPPNEEQMSEMMQSPMFQEMMNNFLDNPQMLDTVISQNPMLRSMGPQARELFQSPMFRQMMSDPNSMRQMMEMQRGMGAAGGGFGAGNLFGAAAAANPAPTDSAANSTNTANTANPAANPFAAMFPGGAPGAGGNPMFNPQLLSSMFGGAGGAASTPAPADTRPPEERYELQLLQLNEMGFTDFERNVTALRRSGGSVQGAIDALLSGAI